MEGMVARFAALVVLLGMAMPVVAEIVTEVVPYQHGEVMLEGFVAYDDTLKDKRPGVLVVHEWWGLNDFAKEKAVELAKMGYVGFAVDMFGKGVLLDKVPDAAKKAGEFRGKPIIRTRAAAGLAVLANHPRVDAKRLGALGFCFGGTTALELAYSGANLAGVVSFHGGLALPQPDDKTISARILALHGADDPFVPPIDVAKFEEAMRAKEADWQLVKYGNAVHSFTNPGADRVGIKGSAYNEKAAKRSWQHMRDFFKEVFDH